MPQNNPNPEDNPDALPDMREPEPQDTDPLDFDPEETPTLEEILR